jgi:cell division protein FtsQ
MLSLRRRTATAAPDPQAADLRVKRDPAPTRWNYRYQRLMLTPMFRIGVRYGLPLAIVIGAGAIWYADDANRATFTGWIEAARDAIQERPEFIVDGMEITGAELALTAAITDLVKVEFPISSFNLDLDAIRRSVVELTAVAQATVRVRPGGTLEIAVVERVPVAVWRYTDGLRLIDEEGVMTGMILSRGDRADLPLIAGDGAKDVIDEALALFRAAAPVADRVRGLVRMGERRWDMVLDRDQRILLPADNPVAALERVMALHQAQDMLSRDITVVDMRIGTRPTIRLNQPALNVLRNISGTEAIRGN